MPKHPLAIKAKREAQKQAALERKPEGEGADFKEWLGRRAKDVELERKGTDRIFVVLAEFGNERYAGAGSRLRRAASPTTRRTTSRTRSPRPSTARCTTRSRSRTASVDNSTLWQEDYDREHYEDMYFNRMAEYYEKQSSGRYSVEGDVTEWVKVPFNQAALRSRLLRQPLGAGDLVDQGAGA